MWLQDSVQLKDLWKKICHHSSGMEFQDHRYWLRTHPNCIVGKELVNWLIRNGHIATRYYNFKMFWNYSLVYCLLMTRMYIWICKGIFCELWWCFMDLMVWGTSSLTSFIWWKCLQGTWLGSQFTVLKNKDLQLVRSISGWRHLFPSRKTCVGLTKSACYKRRTNMVKSPMGKTGCNNVHL